MGAAESTPQPTATYQPDFLTAHVRNVSKQLAPRTSLPTAGQSSFGSDSLGVVQAKKAQVRAGARDVAQPAFATAPLPHRAR